MEEMRKNKRPVGDSGAEMLAEICRLLLLLVWKISKKAIRFAANYVEEDCPQPENVGINMDVFRAFTEGFLEQTADTLTENEVSTLALSSFVLTVELAVRFLNDYIQGSPYFKINYPEHNLVRARCQIALAKDMQRNMEKMEECVRSCYNK